MKKSKKNGFTLVELLAVIVILAIILVIAVPKVMSIIEDAKKGTLESTAKMIAGQAEKTKVQNTVLGKEETITCDSVAKLNDVDYKSCSIEFEENTAKVTIEGGGKFEGLFVCSGTKTNAVAINESCTLRTLIVNLDGGTDTVDYDEKYESGSIVTLVEPTKEGHTFAGWIVSGDGASIDGDKLTVGIETTTVTAIWDEDAAFGVGTTFITNLLEKEEMLNNGLIKDNTSDENIRYVGSNPSNRVYFNCADTDEANVVYGSNGYDYASSCETWRIVGIFSVKSSFSDVNGIQRIKIVRDSLDTQMAWDTTADSISYVNQWGETTLTSDNSTPYAGANLMQYLNGNTDGNYYYSLSSVSKGQIDDAVWNTGSITYNGDTTPSSSYVAERSTATGSGTKVNYTTEWLGKIGLIYPSDYAYAAETCNHISDYAGGCENNNWLYNDSSYWALSPTENSIRSWIISDGGNAIGDYVNAKRDVRPALYLSSNIQIMGGDGNTEPFKLSM